MTRNNYFLVIHAEMEVELECIRGDSGEALQLYDPSTDIQLQASNLI
jgi:hypothetical protein